MSTEQEKVSKKKRAIIKAKFTRTLNVLKDKLMGETPIEVIKNMQKELSDAYLELELQNSEYLSYVESDDDIEKANIMMDDVYRSCCEIDEQICKLSLPETKASIEKPAVSTGKINVKKLEAPKFNGSIRAFPTFIKDYQHYMEPLYGQDAYALRSCLSGEALEIVSGIDDNYNEIWSRLKKKYGEPGKIIDSILFELKSLEAVKEGDIRSLVHVIVVVEHCWLDLKKLGLEREMNTTTMMSMVEKLLPRTQKREWALCKQSFGKSDDTFEDLLNFLLKEKDAVEYMSDEIRGTGHGCVGRGLVHYSDLGDSGSSKENIGNNATLDTLQLAVEQLTKVISSSGIVSGGRTTPKPKCWLHNSDTHEVSNCNLFLSKNNQERIQAIKENGACFRCLKLGHLSRSCLLKKNCDILVNGLSCNKAHHSLLHDAHVSGISFHNSYTCNDNSHTNSLLMLNTVQSLGGYVNALLDPGSNLSLITHRVASKLNLKYREVMISLTRVGNITEIVSTREYEITLIDINGNYWNIAAYGIEDITADVQRVDMSKLAHLFGNMCPYGLSRPFGKVDLLIGLDCCQLLPDKIAEVGKLQLMAGPLGYCIRGYHQVLDSINGGINCNFVQINVHYSHVSCISLKNEMVNFYDIENAGTLSNCEHCGYGVETNISIKEKRELELIKSGLVYSPKLQSWSVHYPWIRSADSLPNNYKSAFGQLKSLEKRLLKSTDCLKLYNEQIQDMICRGVAHKLSVEELSAYSGPIHYIPHHGVTKLSSSSTPLRVVFNSSSVYMGHKLNDYWAKGPSMLNSLIGVILRFREDFVAFVGDISKMFNSIQLEHLEQHTHRFLWREADVNKHPDHYILLAVPFGDRPSGAISIIAMHETARMNGNKYPDASRIIVRNSFVDDILKSVPTVDDAKQKIMEIDSVLLSGNFKVKNWFVSGLDLDMCDDTFTSEYRMINTTEGKILGMLWLPGEDVFKFKVNIDFDGNTEFLTRRMVLSLISQIYDPLGLLIPFTLQGKLLMREVCVLQGKINKPKECCWDENVPKQVLDKCKSFFSEMVEIKNLSFRRCFKPYGAINDPVLIVFCDGSQQSYGACAYIRWKVENGQFISNLICAKNRLAPLKTISIPRLELCSAVIASRLRHTIVEELDIKFTEVYHITDSKIVRDQIQKDSYIFGTFVATRISEIQRLSNPLEWWWTESHNNVADITTRPVNVRKLDTFWKNGPDYLLTDVEYWPISQERSDSHILPDIIKNFQVHELIINDGTVKNLLCVDINRFSNLNKLLRVTAMVLKISLSKSFKCDANNLSVDDIKHALNCWILFVQLEFKGDWKKRFKRLGPMMIESGIITVGRRIRAVLADSWDNESLILLPEKSYFSKLVVIAAHCTNHDGIDSTVAKVRKDYWIPKLVKIAKNVRKNCYHCRIVDKQLCEQVMGQLPLERLKPSPPFYYSAVDLFGPIMIKDCVKKRCQMKSYGVIFNCLTTRGLYLDIACGYDTDSFLLVLRRFVTIRGCPKQIRSDAGSQIVAAGKEWKYYFDNLDVPRVKKFSAEYGISWIINKSGDAAWQNGCSERLIRSVKRCISLTIGSNLLTFPELQTVLFECANVLNERPIGSIDQGHTYFCPNQLILGRSSIKVPGGQFDCDLNPKRRFKFVESLTDNFWKRWHIHYFSSLILHQKWNVEKRNLCVGDIVLVSDANSLRGSWRLAEVSEAKPGADNKVRDVVLRYKVQSTGKNYCGTKDTLINRSVHRLVIIVPIEER